MRNDREHANHIRGQSTLTVRTGNGVLAWTVRVFNRAADAEIKAEYDRQALNEDFMRELVRLSWFDDGPRLAREFLSKHGIHLVIEPQLRRPRRRSVGRPARERQISLREIF